MNNLKYIIFDADDTLWENNIYYETARKSFINLCTIYDLNKILIEEDFITTETRIVREKGYGTRNFLEILNILSNKYLPQSAYPEFDLIINNFTYEINRPRNIFPGVTETLNYLQSKYQLFVLTKGDINEQNEKLKKSGLLQYFTDSFVESEKDVSTYRGIIHEHNWDISEVCMVGNSPKSDINPALQLGIRAVYIHYPSTWYMEDEPLLEGNHLLMKISKVSELQEIF